MANDQAQASGGGAPAHGSVPPAWGRRRCEALVTCALALAMILSTGMRPAR